IDWKQSDTAQAMPDGAYLVVVTVRDFKGNLNQRLAALVLQNGKLQLQNQNRAELTAAQTQAVETRRQGKKVIMNEGDDAVSILQDGKERAVVVTAHDGNDGKVNSSSGSLTFTTGNLFSNHEKEQLRITPEGRVGIGTKTPEATLDVAGTIKARGIQFQDGTILNSATALPERQVPGDGRSGGGGSTPSGTTMITAINDPATTGVINDNRVSLNLARLAYVESSFIKFTPAAEQVSIGDANGTAPMINLRGGSTCCAGPGSHTPAWFKVFQNGSFVATGNLGIGVPPMQGRGYRTSWDSYKGAFRSGYAEAEWDDANVGFFSWAGGSNSTASGLYSLAFGDTNKALSTSSIAFGSGNEVRGAAGFSAGAGNRACDTYSVAFGNRAIAGGPLVDGRCDPDDFNRRGLAAVAMGFNVTADNDYSFAFGKFASTNGFSGTFVWGDGSATSSTQTFTASANNEFAARASGGFRFRTNLGGTTGCNLPAGSGVFICTSSRATKENFLAVSGADVLSRLKDIEVSTWNYISEGRKVRHMGPMAEDFFKAFQLGTGNTAIGVQDLTGVSLAAIKELDQRTTELRQKTAEVEQLREQVNQLERRLATLEQLLTKPQ
ncbi:MAG TPA: tail fiber domain-containing protein, partial [Pyrinomonadaceae bacterium]|nr:tail fiber domain-containing protein [Pyrinomonadaceae bacterium]